MDKKAELGVFFTVASLLLACADSQPSGSIASHLKPKPESTSLNPDYLRIPDGATSIDISRLKLGHRLGINIGVQKNTKITDSEIELIGQTLDKIPALSFLAPGGIELRKTNG